MAQGAQYVVAYRRKRNQRTNYPKRLNLLKSGANRLIVRPSNKHITVQVVGYSEEGDNVLSFANSKELKDFGWNHPTGNIPAAYLTGFLAGARACQAKSKNNNAILDTGLHPLIKGSRIYAALKGAVESGLELPHDESVFPTEERVMGVHITALQGGKDSAIKEGVDAVKKAILSGTKEAKK